VNATVNTLKAVALVDIDATHSFIREQTTKQLHHKVKGGKTTSKAVKSIVKKALGIVFSAPLKFGDLFGVLDLIVVALDEHRVIFGYDFLKLAKVVLVPRKNETSS